MQVFKALLKVVKKNMFTAIVYTVVFILIAVITAKNGNQNSFEAVKIRLTVFDEDNTEESSSLVSLLDEKYELVDIDNNKDDIMDMLYYESTDCVIIIENGYSQKLSAGETEGLFSTYHMHDSYSLVIMEQYLNDYAAAVKAYSATGIPVAEAIDNAAKDISVETNVDLEADSDAGNDDYFEYHHFAPYIIISAFLSLLCPVLGVMERRDIRYRTNCSSVRPGSFVFQLFAGCGVVVFLMWFIIVGVGAAIYGLPSNGRQWLAVLNSFIFAAMATFLAVLISSITTSKNIITLITQALGLGMSFFCGIFVTQDMLGDKVLAVGRFFPAYWYIKLNDMLRGKTIFTTETAMLCFGIQAAFIAAIVMVTLLIRRMKYNSVKAMS